MDVRQDSDTNSRIQTQATSWNKEHTAILEDLKRFREESILREEAKRCEQQKTSFITQIPPRYRGKTFADFKINHPAQARIKKVAERFVETFSERIEEGTNLRFLGQCGTGKTLLAHIMAQALVMAGYSVKYTSSVEFLKSMLTYKFKSQGQYSLEMKAYQETDFLILDEVTESISKDGILPEVERQVLRAIIDERYNHKRPSLVISNRDTQDIALHFGKDIMDRLSEKTTALIFNWPSYRQR